MTQRNFAIKKRSVNTIGSVATDEAEISSMVEKRPKLNINSANLTQSSKFHAPSVSSYSVTNSSYLLGQSTAFGGRKPNIRVEPLDLDEGIKYLGTFDSQKRNGRVTIYSAKITPDETNVPLQL